MRFYGTVAVQIPLQEGSAELHTDDTDDTIRADSGLCVTDTATFSVVGWLMLISNSQLVSLLASSRETKTS